MSRSNPAARLRRTFHYPSDDDDDDDEASPSSANAVLDEQEQDSLIASLTAQNARRNATTHRFLYALPALSTIPFLLGMVLSLFSPSPSSSAGRKGVHPSSLLSLLGLSSLLATGWLLYALSTTETGFPFLDGDKGAGGRAEGQRRATTQGAGRGGATRKRDGLLESGAEDKSPLARHLPWLNAGLAALALLTGLLERVRLGEVKTAGVNPLLLGALPGVVYAVVLGAKVVMAGVDPERELSGLRYRYKGA